MYYITIYTYYEVHKYIYMYYVQYTTRARHWRTCIYTPFGILINDIILKNEKRKKK